MLNETRKQHRIIHNKIRQCRPDKEYGLTEYRNIGFFNKSRNYNYSSYSDEKAIEFLSENFGDYIKDIYLDIDIPQSRSDFFLIASLYCEGGVSSDVCSTCTASVDYLIQDEKKLHILKESNGFQKKFLYAPPNNIFIGQYLDHLISKFEYFRSNGIALEYDNFSSQNVFNDFFKKNLENGNIDTKYLSIINEESYRSIITNDLSEEILLDTTSEQQKKISIRGIVDKFQEFSAPNYDRILGNKKGCVLNKSHNFHILGEDKNPFITNKLKHIVTLPDIELYNIQDITVSGHGSIWKDNAFLRLESYLSSVAEEEMEAGFGKSPNQLPASFSLDEDIIVTFGAGYGCYGHYLLDEIPRLAFTKKILGCEAFHNKKILISSHTPDWAINAMKFFLEIRDKNFVKFDHRASSVHVNSAIIPTYIHKNYNFYPFIKEFYGFYKNNNIQKIPHRRICFSRNSWEQNKVNQRFFLQQDLFEEIAISRGFEIISPETLSLSDQVNLLRETRCQVGEHGSAQYASIYNPHGSTIGTINPLTEIQCNLGRLYNDTNVLAFAQDEYTDANNNSFYSLSEQKIIEFFDAVEREDDKRKYTDHLSMTNVFDAAR